MNIFRSDYDKFNKFISDEFNKTELTPIFWKGLVIDVDESGKKFKSNIKGAIKYRIEGLHNHINEQEGKGTFPIAIPFFGESGFINQLPQLKEYIWVVYETLQPVGQAYWLGLVPQKEKLHSSNTNKSLYDKLFGK